MINELFPDTLPIEWGKGDEGGGAGKGGRP